MAKPSAKTPDEKLRIVLAVLEGELSAAEAGRRHGVSEQTISNWRRAFLDAGRAGLVSGKDRRHSAREAALEAEIEDLEASLGKRTCSCVCGSGALICPPVEDLEMIRQEAQLTISRFVELIEVPRRSSHCRLAKHRAGMPAKGPWPAPVVDVIEPTVAKYAQEWPARGHRKIWALMAHDADPDAASMSSVRLAMARRDPLQPVRYQAERRQRAVARRAVFIAPSTRRNRVWQMDFSEFESTAGGIWRIGGVVDYVATPALACRVATTQTAADMIAALDVAVAEAERLLGRPLITECVDDETGEIEPIAVVSDNGPRCDQWPSRAGSPPGRTSCTSAPATRARRPTV